MFNDFLKWCLRTVFIGIFWVFFLSITIDGRPLFSYANETLVQNRIVRYLDEELADLWYRVKETARLTFSDMSEIDRKA